VQQSPGQQPQPSGQQPPRSPGQQPQIQQTLGQQPPPQVQQLQQKTLTPTEAQKRIQDLNQNRTAMQGINRNPLPSGQVTVYADGRHTIAASGGRHIDVRPNGTVEKVALRDGRTATFRPDGKISAVNTGGMQIYHRLHGERYIVTERPDKSVLVSTGLQRGYLQRPIVVHDRPYVQRTYVVNNVTYTRIYRTYNYRGVAYYQYVPVYYYRPVFYGWVYNPWPAPVYYRWAWYNDPWYGYYSPYFVPYSAYPTASLWLTDFLLAENLKLAYQAQAQANALAVPPAAGGNSYAMQLTPEVKQAIAEEVRQQLAAERQAATALNPQPLAPSSTEVPSALDPRKRVFVVSSSLDKKTADGQECSLTPGDIITRLTDTPDANQHIIVSVLHSKQADCPAGAQIMVAVQDLQEMQNHFREQIDAGLKTLAENQGKGGLPAAPDTRTQPGEVPPPEPDASIATLLQHQQQQADRTEQEMQ